MIFHENNDMSITSVSVVIVTLNCKDALKECLIRLKTQQEIPDNFEILVVDGGSSDGTKEIALEFGASFIEGGYKDNQEARRLVGINKANNQIVLILDSDNFIPHKSWLKNMIAPFSDSQIIGSFPMRYQYEPQETLMNRYFALMGVNDPIPFYLGKADRLSYLFDNWNMSGHIIEENGSYYKIRFNPDDLPTIGCNGFFLRREAVIKLSLKPEEFFHIDVNYDLVKKGLDTYAVVKDGIIHSTGQTFMYNLKKRLSYKDIHHTQMTGLRRYKVFDFSSFKDRINLIKFIFFSLTLIEPLVLSIRGYFRVRDRAWFLHPFVCLGFVFAYGFSSIKSIAFKRREK